jgi:phasin family protein
MNPLSRELLSAAPKASVEALFGLSNATVEGFQKLAALNLQTVRLILAESHNDILAALSIKDSQELATLQPRLTQKMDAYIQSYRRQAFMIVAEMQTGLEEVVEVQLDAHDRRMYALADGAAQELPGRPEAAVIAIRSSIDATNTLCQAVHRVTRHAVDVAGSNLGAAIVTASKATQQAHDHAPEAVKK